MNFFKNPVINISQEKYLGLLIILAPLLNFVSGITFDLHAPSLPAIASYFSSSVAEAKSTITFTLFGFSLGCLFFGFLLDFFGRRPVLLAGLLLYTLVSFLAPFSPTINTLLFVRLVQGFSVSCMGLCGRTIIMDNFTGYQFKVGILYTSLAFGLGPIIAPFIGGYLQDNFGWKASFFAYGIVSCIFLIIVFLCLKESKPEISQKFSLKIAGLNYLNIIKHDAFIPGIIIVGLSEVMQLIYTVTGAFLVEDVLHYSAVTYGKSALLVSCGYLLGTLANRVLLRHYPVVTLINLGIKLLFSGIAVLIVCGLFKWLNLFTIVLPMFIIGFSQGFVFINTYTCCLRTSNTPGAIVSLITASLMTIGTLGIYVISFIEVTNLGILGAIFLALAIGQGIVFTQLFKRFASEK